MNRIDVLIQQHCPNGVDFIPLGRVCASIKTGKLNANAQEERGKYPFFTCDAEPYRINTYAFDCEAILVTGNGSQVGHINYYNGKFNAYQRTYVLSSFDKSISIFYALYYFKAHLKEYILIKSKKGSVPYITLPMLLDFIIPIPPLPVQEEIVTVLDTFTELQAELQTELQKRLQQYNYYRDNLLSFEGRTDVEWITIEQLFHRKNGYTPSKANPDFWTNGTIPWFRMEDIRENGRILTNSIQKVHPSAVKKNSLVRAGSIILATSATIGEHALVNVDCLTNQRFTCLTVKEDYNHKVDIKFIFYYMFKVDEWCKTHTVQGNFPGVDMSLFPNVSIPLPTLDEQKRIASILDRFDALTTDLTAGLPAEIEKRRQQYEYYRDKLLTFKRKEA